MRPVVALFAANAISMTGNRLTTLAVPWFVLTTTGSASKTGITAFFTILPVVLAGFFGGAIVDRLGFRRTSVISDLASGVTVAAIALLHADDLLSFPLLLVLVFLGALLDAPGGTARAALVPDLAETAGMSLERAGSLMQVVERGSRLVGAPLAGVLIAAVGPVTVLWIDALTFMVSAVLVHLAIPDARPSAETSVSAGYLAELREGLAFIRGDRLILAVVMTVMVTNFLDAANGGVVLPVFAKNTYDSAVAIGLLFGASGGGSVVGALVYGAWGDRVSRRAVFIPCFMLIGVGPLLLAASPRLPLAVGLWFLYGAAAGPLNPILLAVEFERIPAAMRGRVFGALTAGAYVAMPAGVLLGGYLVEGFGVRATLIGIGTLYIAATATLILNPAIRDMDTGRPNSGCAP